MTWQGIIHDAIVRCPIEVTESQIIREVFKTFDECNKARRVRNVY
jgi:hypothetical protein